MLSRAVDQMVARLEKLRFAAPVTHVYNPNQYARAPLDLYLDKYGKGRKEAVLLGMNPGPWGMAQTGIPFGEVAIARDWLEVEATVGSPKKEHPKRPILGFACTRSEVSGARLWGWAKATHATPDKFFKRFFVWNYCPLVFMEEGGKNFTPDKLPSKEAAPLYAACDDMLRAVVDAMKPRLVIGVGVFAEERAKHACGDSVTIARVLHPSPASPLANKDWAGECTRTMASLGL